MENEEIILQHFFTNTNKPIFALKNMPQAMQNYLYMGVSRFPNMRERLLKLFKDKGCLEKVAEAIKQGNSAEEALKPVAEFAAEKNKAVFFEFGHKSAGEGASIAPAELPEPPSPIEGNNAQEQDGTKPGKPGLFSFLKKKKETKGARGWAEHMEKKSAAAGSPASRSRRCAAPPYRARTVRSAPP